jgi:acetylornithine deacetylase
LAQQTFGGTVDRHTLARLDAAAAAEAEAAFGFLAELVAAAPVLGAEARAQQLVGEQFAALGFDVSELSVDPAAVAASPAGVGRHPYAGRPDVLATRAGGGGGSGLLLNGHVDVVPAADGGWSSPAFTPTRRDGWLFGRGAGDMKGGFAMVVLALRALRAVAPGVLDAPLAFLSAIEEECSGNGSWAAAQADVLGDVVLLAEPTDLRLLLAGVGVLWVDILVSGAGGHAEGMHRSGSPWQVALDLVERVRWWARGFESDPDDALTGAPSPYNVNLGRVRAGDWHSSVPAEVQLGLRVGFPRSCSPERALSAIEQLAATAGTPDTAVRVRASGLRAEGYALDAGHPFARLVAGCHAQATGAPPPAYGVGSTTDARFYLNQCSRPALCYGPRTRNIHGADEAVELASIVDGARVLARVIAACAEQGAELPQWRLA